MRMLSPMNANAYSERVKAIHGAAKVVAKVMKNAAEEAKHFYEPEEDGVYDTGISAVEPGDAEDSHAHMELLAAFH